MDDTEELQLMSEYFPLNSSVRGLLDIFGNLMGMDFQELSPKDVNYKAFISNYLSSSASSSKIDPAEVKLRVFCVQNNSWNSRHSRGITLGYLVLDLIERKGKQHGKTRGAECTHYCSVRHRLHKTYSHTRQVI